MDKTNTYDYQIIQVDVNHEITHGIKVSNLAYLLGKKLSLSDEMCYHLAVAGLLHDIGKLEMAKFAYRKKNREGTLRVEEMRYVRTHSNLGYVLLHEQEYPGDIAQWVLYHHENYDGSGYPSNLSGEQIPLGARILRICDVFTALSSDRPYRKAFDRKTVIELMIAEVKNFDMKIFLKFMELVHTSEVDRVMEFEGLTESQMDGFKELCREYVDTQEDSDI